MVRQRAIASSLHSAPDSRRRLSLSFFPLGFAVVILAVVMPATLAGADQAPVTLGTAATFGVLAGGGITNSGVTTVDGDIGTYPTTVINGGGSLTVTGTNHGGDTVSQSAQNDLDTAYTAAASEGPIDQSVAALGGQTLSPGVYNSASAMDLDGTLTLAGGGDPNATYVFQAGTTLTAAAASQVILVGGAQSCNVFWEVGDSADIGTDSNLSGTVMASGAITVASGSSVDGRLLAMNGAVTLDTDTITTPDCGTTPPPATGQPQSAISPATGGPSGGKAVAPVSVEPSGSQPTETTTPPTTVPSSTTTTTNAAPLIVGGREAKGSHQTGNPTTPCPAGTTRSQGSVTSTVTHIRVVDDVKTNRLASGVLGCGAVAGSRLTWPIALGASAVALGLSLIGVLRRRRRLHAVI
jgi:hypothetical protein